MYREESMNDWMNDHAADIQKHLRQAQLVGNDIFMEYILCINIQLLLFRMYRFLYNCI